MTKQQFKDYLIARLIEDIQQFEAAFATNAMNEVFIEEIPFIKDKTFFEIVFQDFKKEGEYTVQHSKFEDYYLKILLTVKDEFESRGIKEVSYVII
jgi:hypothetical protein